MIKLSVLKNWFSGILSVGNPNISVVSGTLSVGHPSFSVVSGILSVVGIPPVPIPIPEKIQLLMYECKCFIFNLLLFYDFISYEVVLI